MRKLGLREFRWLARSQAASQWQSCSWAQISQNLAHCPFCCGYDPREFRGENWIVEDQNGFGSWLVEPPYSYHLSGLSFLSYWVISTGVCAARRAGHTGDICERWFLLEAGSVHLPLEHGPSSDRTEHRHPRKKPHTHEQSLPFSPPSAPGHPSLLSVPVDLPVLDIPHKWNHIKCGLLHWYLSLGVMFSVQVEVDFIKWISLESTKFGIDICLAWCFHINWYKKIQYWNFHNKPKM